MFEIIPMRVRRELDSISHEMDRLWGDFFDGRPLWFPQRWSPPLDLTEKNGNLILKAELPGIDPKDISIDLRGDMLTVRGEKKEKKEKNRYLLERRYGSFVRIIRLPVEIKEDKIKASYKDGILNIEMPKAKEAKKKEIRIKVEPSHKH
jgi:HSP20 family protein